MADAVGERRPQHGFRDVLRGEFAVIWLASAQSVMGDQLARVALSILVFDRTGGSALATAAVYGLTFLPELLGSVLFGHYADKFPRRGLLVAGDCARAVLLALMALPWTPLWLVCVLLAVAVLIAGPWQAAEYALIADVLTGERYVVGTGLRVATTQSMQIVGFAVGGLVIAVVGARAGLVVDAATFAVSAGLIAVAVRARPSAATAPDGGPGRPWWHGAVKVLADPALRRLLLYSWLVGLLVLPEGLAAPYAADLGRGSVATGLLLAALPAGAAIGALWFARVASPGLRRRLLRPLAVVAGIPLVACATQPGVTVTIVLWALTGACTCYLIEVQARFVARSPAAIRGQALAVASGGLLAAQAVGLVGGGALTAAVPPSSCIAIAGGAAVICAAVLASLRTTHTRA